jgi:aminopeptidase
VNDDLLTRYAELIVGFAANVQPGQIVSIFTGPGKESLTRACAREAYRRGARFVDPWYFDGEVKRARIEFADESTLDYVPPWLGERLLKLGEQRAARISFSPPVDPGVLHGLDPLRAGRDQLPRLKELTRVVGERTTNWTAAPCPIPTWAQVVHPGLAEDDALSRLWDEIVTVCRLDEADPAAAWRKRMGQLDDVAARLRDRRLDALHFEGPGTDLTVGLLPSTRWLSAMFSTIDGLPHLVNLPSEEVFATPDPQRVEGHVRSTRPLELAGTMVDGLRVRFEQGRAVEIDADVGADALRVNANRDPGGSRLGEVALVDRESRIGKLGTTFCDTLLDENAASHIALGQAYVFAVEDEADRARANRSEIHVDFMIGSDDVAVTGITNSGERLPILRDGAWQL